jgi:magnesium-transporting ATPase (P-type)
MHIDETISNGQSEITSAVVSLSVESSNVVASASVNRPTTTNDLNNNDDNAQSIAQFDSSISPGMAKSTSPAPSTASDETQTAAVIDQKIHSQSQSNNVSVVNAIVNVNTVGGWHALPTAEHAVAKLESSLTQGLTSTEAERRRTVHGFNRLTPPNKPGFLKRLWGQVNNALVFILLVAAVVTGAFREWAESGLIIGVVIINVAIGLIQEGNAEKAAEAIKGELLYTVC